MEDRVERYLDECTKTLIRECEVVLIKKHSRGLWKFFQSPPDYKDEDFRRIHALLSRVSDGLT